MFASVSHGRRTGCSLWDSRWGFFHVVARIYLWLAVWVQNWLFLFPHSWQPLYPTDTGQKRISKELLDTCQRGADTLTILKKTKNKLVLSGYISAAELLLIWCDEQEHVMWTFWPVTTYRIRCKLCTEEESSGGGKGPEHGLSSFRSAQSRISSLTEMLLSLCQIRFCLYTHITPQWTREWAERWESCIEVFPRATRSCLRLDFSSNPESKEADIPSLLIILFTSAQPIV